MRQAETPDDPRDPHLSNAGRARAEKLAGYVPTDLGFQISSLLRPLRSIASALLPQRDSFDRKNRPVKTLKRYWIQSRVR